MNRIGIAALALALTLPLGACVTKGNGLDTPSAAQLTQDSIARARDAEAARQQRAAEEQARLAALKAERDREIRAAMDELTAIVFFEFDSDKITSEAAAQLRRKAEILRNNPAVHLRIEGHADVRGSAEYNLSLGQRRANAVREYLEGFGISRSRMTTLSFGKERPIVPGSDEQAHRQNRRTEFVVAKGSVNTVR